MEHQLKIGVIGAMEVEMALLTDRLADVRTEKRAGMTFYCGALEGVPCVVVQSGVGKVNAALCTQVLASVFGVTHVINTGVAGSLDATIDIGDVVVSTDCVHHDVDATNFGYALGQVPGMPEAYPADAALRAAALDAVAQAAPDIAAFEGRVASGDSFVRDNAEKSRIVRDFGARCCEMEGAAIAQACTVNGLPFVVVRAISDKADGSHSELYPVFEAKAARHCAAIVAYLVAHLPQSPRADAGAPALS